MRTGNTTQNCSDSCLNNIHSKLRTWMGPKQSPKRKFSWDASCVDTDDPHHCSKKDLLVKKNNRIRFYSLSQVSVLIATLALNISDRCTVPPSWTPGNSIALRTRLIELIPRLNCVMWRRPPGRATRPHKPHKHNFMTCCRRLDFVTKKISNDFRRPFCSKRVRGDDVPSHRHNPRGV